MRKRFIPIYCFVILLIISSIFFIGCSNGDSPKKTVEAVLTSIQNKDFNAIGQYISESANEKLNKGLNGELDKEFGELKEPLINLVSKVQFKILDEKVSGDNAQVQVELTVDDLGDQIIKAMPDIMSSAIVSSFSGESKEKIEEKLRQKVKEILNTQLPKKTETETVYLKKVNDKWVLEENEKNKDFIFMLLGNFEPIEYMLQKF